MLAATLKKLLLLSVISVIDDRSLQDGRIELITHEILQMISAPSSPSLTLFTSSWCYSHYRSRRSLKNLVQRALNNKGILFSEWEGEREEKTKKIIAVSWWGSPPLLFSVFCVYVKLPLSAKKNNNKYHQTDYKAVFMSHFWGILFSRKKSRLTLKSSCCFVSTNLFTCCRCCKIDGEGNRKNKTFIRNIPSENP